MRIRKSNRRAAVAAAILALLATPAAAQYGSFQQATAMPKRMTLVDPTPGCVATVRIHNRAGHYNATETLETPRGPVSIEYVTVGGHQPGDDDRITVTDLPDGLGARPMEASIVDGETLDVCLFDWVLG